MNYIVVGLGNPGEQYASSRHNTGFMVLDAFVSNEDWESDAVVKGVSHKGSVEKHTVYSLKPHTMMNKSGLAVSGLALKRKVKPENIIVVHDDVDMPIGSIKIVKGRGAGGHNGVRSVQRSLKTKDFVRVKIGVSAHTPAGKIRKPKGEKKVLEHLLGRFTKKDEIELKKILKHAVEAIETIIVDGPLEAMNQFN